MKLDLAVNPYPWQRTQISAPAGRRLRIYTSDPLEQFYDDFRWATKAAGIRRPLTGPLRLHTLRLWRRCRTTSVGDIDNLVKAVLDAGQVRPSIGEDATSAGVLWVNDRQFREIGFVRLEAWGPKVDGRILLEVIQLAKEAG